MSEQTLQGNIDKIQAMSKAIMLSIAEAFENERPDLVLLALLDSSVKVASLLNPTGTVLENCDAVLAVMTGIRNGEATGVPCNQVGCLERATHWYLWPTSGERKESCAKHTQKAIETLHAIGFELQAHLLIPAVPSSAPEHMGG